MAIVGPIALYSNVPIAPQYFAPWRFVISAITLGETTAVTVVVPSITMLNYVIGQQVRLIIPPTFGCRQLNEQTAYVFAIATPNVVYLTLDSTGADPYIASSATTQAQILAIGDIVSGPINKSRSAQSTLIPGSFINISPAPI